MKLAVAAMVTLVAFTRPAAACGVPDHGEILVDVAKAFETKTRRVHTPIVIAGGGTSSEGGVGSVGIGASRSASTDSRYASPAG